jgi:bis(5'-nucleosyl)-tetraphosphatase (symmetrical)
MPRYYFLIGDVHGCFHTLCAALKAVSFDAKQDVAILAGDLINRGEESLSVLRMVYDHQDSMQMVMGNHDFYLLGHYYGYIPHAPNPVYGNILESKHASTLCQWLIKQPFARVIEQQALVVHAGVHPHWTNPDVIHKANVLSEYIQDTHRLSFFFNHTVLSEEEATVSEAHQQAWTANVFTHMRFIKKKDEKLILVNHSGKVPGPETYAKQWYPWYEWRDTTTTWPVFFGHWSALQGRIPDLQKAINVHPLDNGCIWHRPLLVIRLQPDMTMQRYLIPYCG